MALSDEFERLGPWRTRFQIDGQELGGDYDAAADARLQAFFEACPSPGRVLELGSLEGGHSVALAARAQEVIALEVRPQNLARARLVQRLVGAENIEFLQWDLEQRSIAELGDFDAIFCVGLLYHLSRPWELVKQFAAPLAFIWTHYAKSAEVTVAGHDGRWYQEFGWDDPLSGVRPVSFWPTLDTLKGWFSGGYSEVEVLGLEDHAAGPSVSLVATKKGRPDGRPSRDPEKL